MKLSSVLTFALAGGAMLALAAPSFARTKLVTLPGRDVMVVNMEHPTHSLLMEERDITLQEGTNFVDFSWQGVNIDSNSILLELLSNPGDEPESTKIVSVAFPPNEQALTWQLFTPESRTERIRVSYLLYGVNRNNTYEMVVDAEETEARLQHYFEVRNQSGEDFEDASFRVTMADDWERSIESGEVRRFLAENVSGLPVRKVFETSPRPFSNRGEEGEVISLIYEFDNDRASSLGEYKLPAGKTRVFAEDPDGSTLFIGEDVLEETPVGEESDIRLGTVRDILLKRRIVSDRQENQRRNDNRRVVLHDRVVEVRYESENFKEDAATVRIVEQLDSAAEIVRIDSQGVTTERVSATELEIVVDLEARPTGEGEEVPVREVTFIYRVPDIIS